MDGITYKVIHQDAANIYSHAVREDTSTGSIFNRLLFPGLQEVEIMNMDLSVGDSFCFRWIAMIPGKCDQFATVDSVYFQGGRKIIRFDADIMQNSQPLPNPYSIQSENFKFIEGIGPNTKGPGVRSEYGVVLCLNKDGSNIYQLENGKPCILNNIGISKYKTEELSIYPNPTTGLLNIKGNLQGDPHYIVYDLTGRRVVDEVISGHTVNIGELSKGLYILHISTQNQIIQTKILKK